MKARSSRPRNSAEDAVVLKVRIQPRASKNDIAPMEGGGVKIRLTAPPVNGAANEALVKFLAERASVPKSAVEIVSGRTSRDKVVRISGASPETMNRLLYGKGE